MESEYVSPTPRIRNLWFVFLLFGTTTPEFRLTRFVPMSRWVLLGKSDIVPADVAAAAAAGHHHLNFSPLPMIPIW
jgi:hypothetical protein